VGSVGRGGGAGLDTEEHPRGGAEGHPVSTLSWHRGAGQGRMVGGERWTVSGAGRRSDQGRWAAVFEGGRARPGGGRWCQGSAGHGLVGSVGRGGGPGPGTSRVLAGDVSWGGHPGVSGMGLAGGGRRRWVAARGQGRQWQRQHPCEARVLVCERERERVGGTGGSAWG
jgi:hypothetical protein